MAKFRHSLNGQVLDNEPLNWETLTIEIKRSRELFGMMRKFTQSLQFWGDGREILKNAYEADGVDADVTYLGEIFDYDNYQYETLYEGRMNFDNYKEVQNEDRLDTVEINIEEESFETKIMNGLDTEVELLSLTTKSGQSITPFSRENVGCNYQGQALSKSYVAKAKNDLFTQYFQTLNQEKSDRNTRTTFMVPNTDEITSDSLQDTFNYPLAVATSDPTDVSRFILRCQEDGEYQVTINLDFDWYLQLSAGSDAIRQQDIAVFLQKGDGNTIAVDNSTLNPSSGGDVSLNNRNYVWPPVGFPTTYNLTLKAGDELYFYVRFQFKEDDNGGNNRTEYTNWDITINQFDIDIQAQTTFRAVGIDVMFPFEAVTRIVESLTDEANAVDAPIFERVDQDVNPPASNGEASFLSITQGKKIRNFDTFKHSTSLGEFIKAYDACYALGAAVLFNNPNRLFIGKREDFYEDTLINTYDSVSVPTLTISGEYYYSKVTIGFRNFQLDDKAVDGQQQFNTIREYSTPLRTISPNTYDQLSPYIGSGFVIEYMRRQQFNVEEQEELRFDENTMIIGLRDIGSGGVTQSTSMVRQEIRLVRYDSGAAQFSYFDAELTVDKNDILYEDNSGAFEEDTGPTISTTLSTNDTVRLKNHLVVKPQSDNYTYEVNVTGDWNVNVISGSFFNVTIELVEIEVGVGETVLQTYLTGPATSGSYNMATGVLNQLTGDNTKEYYLRVETVVGGTFDVDLSSDYVLQVNFPASLVSYPVELPEDIYPGIVITGIDDPDNLANYRISPRQNIDRHGPFLKATTFRKTSKVLENVITQKNVDMQASSPTIIEAGDVDLDTVTALFDPEFLECEIPFTWSDLQAVYNNQFGYFRINYKTRPEGSRTFDGYIDNLKFNPEEAKAQVKLLRRPT